MKYLIVAAIVIITILTTCETEHFVSEDAPIIAGKGIAIAQQPNKPLPVDFFVEDVVERGLCYVGQTFTIKANVPKVKTIFTLGFALFETNNDSIIFMMDTDPLLEFIGCDDYYKDGGTYTFTIYINGINIYEWDDPSLDIIIKSHGKRKTPIFIVSSVIMITEELKNDLQAAKCWAPDVLQEEN